MTVRWQRTIFGVFLAAFLGSLGIFSAGLGAQEPAPAMSETVFRNIQVLKGIPADEFMDTMGMFASSLLFDCTGCHVKEILIDRNAFATATPRIQRARQMIVMVNTINKNFFKGEPRVTCFTCHRGANEPEVVPDLALQYGEVMDENPNSMRVFPDARVSPEKVLARYIQESGGADRVGKLTSYVATGTYAGFNTGDAAVPIEIYAKAPNQRTQIVRTFEGDAVRTFDGRSAWAAEGWRQIPLMTFTGGNLIGARVEAVTAFPAGIAKAFARWQGTLSTIDDRNITILQGTNEGELPVNFYFDEETGLLVRTVRWSRTTVGTIPTQTDYSEYRDVGGLKLPFHLLVRWTNGQNTIELKEIRPNVAIPAERFARPQPFKPK
jgi:photosynthetic reaction center cytochrome c subunit